MLERAHGPDAVYPSTDRLSAEHGGRYVTPAELLTRWDTLPAHRFLFGHCVASLADRLPVRHSRATFLRDPVERSISIAQLHARNTGRDVSELVEDQAFIATHVADLQTRIFGVDATHGHLRPQESPPADDAMLESAIARLRTFEFVGTTETMRSSLQRFDRLFGTRTSEHVQQDNRSEAGDLARSEVARRIRPWIERDLEMYSAIGRSFHRG